MDRSPPIRPSPPSRGRGKGGGRGLGPPPPLQQHQNFHYPAAAAWTPPTLHMRPQDHHHHHAHQHQQHSVPSNVEWLESIDRAVAKARRDLLAAGESVSSWKVSQAAVLALQVESWSSFVLSMQQVPALQSLMAVEGKINSFIHCFVETRRIASLYDLERAICKDEGIERFEELELGSFLQYPLVVHYFSLNSDVTEVFEITSEEIVCHLGEYLSIHKSRKNIEIGDLLSSIAEKKSVSEVEKLGVRIQNLGLYISFILDAKRSEETCLRTYLKELTQEVNNEQRPVDICMALKEDYSGKALNFVSSRSDDEDGDNFSNEDKQHDDDCNRDEKSDQHMHIDAEWFKRDMEERDKFLTNKANYTKKGKRKKGASLVLETSNMRLFMKTWKEACQASSISEVIEKMLDMYEVSKKRQRKICAMLPYPLVGLLNVALCL